MMTPAMMSALDPVTDSSRTSRHVRKVPTAEITAALFNDLVGANEDRRPLLPPILLQKSKVASVRIFGETLKRELVDDSDYLSRTTEVAHEFCVRRRGPSDFYTKTAPAALRIFDSLGKTTFAILSAR
jgi:hypothetical protein